MNSRMPGRLTMMGGGLITAGGIVSLVVGLTFGAVVYEPDPLGLFGHVGVVSGLAAMVSGALLVWFGRLEHRTPRRRMLAALVSVVVGHLGAVTGALIVGTAGVVLCYVAGIWLLIQAIVGRRGRGPRSD